MADAPLKLADAPRGLAFAFPSSPLLILLGGLMVTALVVLLLLRAADLRERERFDRLVDGHVYALRERVDTYVALLRATAGMFASHGGTAGESEFRRFVASIALADRYPGIQGIGYSPAVPPGGQRALMERMRRDGVRDFRIWPQAPDRWQFPIVYLEPNDARNAAAVGFDMYSEDVRREAMDAARDSGEPRASGRVTLVQEIDADRQAGFLIYVPLYAAAEPPRTVEARRAALVAFAYAPFRAGDLLGPLFHSRRAEDRLGVSIYDGKNAVPANLLYAGPAEEAPDGERRHEKRLVLQLAGRTWTLYFHSLPGTGLPTSLSEAATLAAAFGLLTTLLLAALARAQGETREREREQAARLAASERRLKTVYDVTPIGLAVADDASARMIRPNRTLAAMLGIEQERNASLSAPADERLRGVRVLRNGRELAPEEQPVQVAASGRGVHGERIDLAFDDGRVLRLLAEAAPVRDENGQPAGAVAAFIDVGEREALLESERAARGEAERANRIKDEFLATVSHELRTPLSAILGWARILRRRRLPPDDLDQGLSIIERNAQAQAQLIEDLLDTSRIVAGKVRLDLEPVDLGEVVASTVESVRPAAEAKGVALRKRLPQDTAWVRGDARRLQQVAWNLLSNAIKFTEPGGAVEVEVVAAAREVRLTVSDTGVGFDNAVLPQLFDRFRQADGSTTRRHGGLGLGLSIVRHLAELHGGRASGASEGPGRGARFTVELPRLEPLVAWGVHAPPQKSDDREPRPQGIEGVRVLVVDDEPDARSVVEQLLRECDAVTLHAGSAPEALEMVVRERPDVVLSDIGMPGEDGYSLVRRLRALGADEGGDTPAVALTSFTRPEDRDRALEAGFQAFLGKPVMPARLIATVARLTGRATAAERR